MSSNSQRISHYVVAIMVMIVLAGCIYYGVSKHSFLVNWDDERYVVKNYDIYKVNFVNIKSIFSSIYVGNYAPLHILSYMLDYALFELNPVAYKIENVVFHIISCFFFYLFLRRHSQFSHYAALFAALIFLVHPVQVESVAWISQRKSVLAGCFFLLALLSYGEFRTRSDKQHVWYWLSVTSFALALLAKSVAVVLIPLLLLGDRFLWPDKTAGKLPHLRKWIPFAMLGCIFVMVTLYAQAPSSGGRGGLSGYPGGSPWTTALTMLPVLPRYFLMLVCPLALSPAYDVPIRTAVDSGVVGGLLFAVLLVVIGVWLLPRSRMLFFWYLLIFITLLPVMQIIPLVTLMNDRYLYLPMLGVSAIVGGAPGHLWTIARSFRGVVGSIGVVLILTLSWLSFRQVAVWADSMTLWQHAVVVEPRSVVARVAYGATLVRAGRSVEAEPLLREVLAEVPYHREAMVNLAQVLLHKGGEREAEALLRSVTMNDPYFSQGHELLGIVLFQGRRFSEAELSFREAIKLERNSIQAKVGLGTILLESRELDEAEEVLSEAWRQAGARADLAYALGCVYALQGKPSEAIAYLKHAAKLGLPALHKRLTENPELDALRGLQEFDEVLELADSSRRRR